MALRFLGVLLAATAFAGCGGGDSRPELVDGSRAAELPAELADLDDAVMTRVRVLSVADVDETRLRACGGVPDADGAALVERVGTNGSSLTFAGPGSSINGCGSIPDAIEDPDRPFGGVWCQVSLGFLVDGALSDPRLGFCTDTADELTAFVWIEPEPETKWVVVSDAGGREVYEVAAEMPVRVTSTENIDPSGSASFEIEEYAADGRKLRQYVLDAQVAG